MEEPRLPANINPNNFPAKLWQLVNSPHFHSIRWDARGEGLIIDQPLFEREVLGTGPVSDRVVGATGIFKSKNFTSLIRQLNLYGFRRPEQVGSTAGGGDGGGSPGPLHHFCSPHFRRDQPDLLIHVKRLTKANKAKLAAGLEVKSRPPNSLQRLLSTSLHGDLLLPPTTAGLLTVGQFHQPYHQGSFFPYSYISTSSQNQSILLTKSLDQTPVSSTTWQGSLGLLPGHEASPTFPDKEVPFPVLRMFPTEATYTLLPVASPLPLQQGSQTMATSLPNNSSYTSSTQYSQAYYPTAALQCRSPPLHTDALTGCASPMALMDTHCSFFQQEPLFHLGHEDQSE
ncbi:heat shock factor protein 5 isoform X2 [Tyto alba]|uniref:heat shock factor protein 5 isoform X2 n=1 Tax=Tyto alba TaxID=56313 RepID=UPI001C6732B9|nr:heat shock factor protein 5 isoform X2 [Tyto alba]